MQFDSKAKIIISDNLSDDIDSILIDENISDIGLIVDSKVSNAESIKNLKTALNKKYRLRYNEIEINEPTTDMVNQYANEFRKNVPELFIGIGGGSTLDLVKAISVMSVHRGVVEDYHGTGKTFTQGIRKILIPTTSGTGAEVTKGAVLVNEKNKFKRAIGGKHITADYAVLYAELTSTMPDNVTAATGLDALAHAIESYTAKCANEITRMYSLKAFSLIFNNLPKVFEYKENLQYRKNVLLGSCLAGYAIYNSDTGACHAMSYPLGIYNHVPHGTAVATLLPKVIATNIKKGASQYATLYDVVDEVPFFRNANEKLNAFLEQIHSFKPFQYIGKTFRDYGINESNIDFLAERGLDLKSALSNNPVEFTLNDSISIYQQLMKESTLL
ncbi:MAG: iron-containing alcohol dehydrogenase [Prevotella sp.]|jgi:alcohol dehydrogenase|nr:iron-containing alcohol dehydrogenase [Prevotella sp.]